MASAADDDTHDALAPPFGGWLAAWLLWLMQGIAAEAFIFVATVSSGRDPFLSVVEVALVILGATGLVLFFRKSRQAPLIYQLWLGGHVALAMVLIATWGLPPTPVLTYIIATTGVSLAGLVYFARSRRVPATFNR